MPTQASFLRLALTTHDTYYDINIRLIPSTNDIPSTTTPRHSNTATKQAGMPLVMVTVTVILSGWGGGRH